MTFDEWWGEKQKRLREEWVITDINSIKVIAERAWNAAVVEMIKQENKRIDMKICKCCGQRIPYQHIRYGFDVDVIQFIGKSYDDEMFNIWQTDGTEPLKESDAKQGKWKDRRKLFGPALKDLI